VIKALASDCMATGSAIYYIYQIKIQNESIEKARKCRVFWLQAILSLTAT
jgi:hypothetical protein